TYYWRVSARNAAGTGSPSDVQTFTVGGPTYAPTLYSPSDNSLGIGIDPTLSWSYVGEASSYQLQVARDSTFLNLVFHDSTITSTSTQVGPLEVGVTYSWRVRGRNSAGAGPYSTARRFTVSAPVVAPQQWSPGYDEHGDEVNTYFSWSFVSNASGYQLQVAIDSLFHSFVFNDSTLTSTSKTLGPLETGFTYFWRVRARNSAGAGPFSETRPFSLAPPTSAPNLSTPSDRAVGQSVNPYLWWSSVPGAKRYHLQVATDSGFISFVVSDSTVPSYYKQIGPLEVATTYYWRVRGMNALGSGPFSLSRSFTTLGGMTSAPTLTSPANGAIGQRLSPSLYWGYLSGATHHHLQVARDSSFGLMVLNDSVLTNTNADIGPLEPATRYYWRVKSRNQIGWGPFSEVWHFTTLGGMTSAPTLTSPSNGAVGQRLSPSLYWGYLSGAISYHLQVARDSSFGLMVLNDSALTNAYANIGPLEPATRYYWRVKARNQIGWGPFSEVWHFTTTMWSVQSSGTTAWLRSVH
ncbi:MAG: hypothetical protein ACRDGA_00765, partial [Bacteroidota bacterium]